MKKLLSIILAVLMVASIAAFAGCGEEAAAPSDTDVAEPVTLIYWSMWNSTEPQAMVIQEAIDAYTADTGIKVQVEWKGRDIKTLIQAALEAGEQIDLFDEDFQRVAQTYGANCMDLDSMATAAGYDDFAVAALPNAIRGWAGSLKAIAYQPYTSGIFYNVAMFNEAGITTVPETWDDFLAACQKLKDAGFAPLAQDDAYVLYTYGYQLARYIGQDAVKDIVHNNGYDNEYVLKAAQDIQALVDNGYLSEGAPGAYPENENTIGFEETAMIVNASWVPGEITNNTGCDLEWGMFNYPSNGGVDANTIANIGAQALAIPSYSPNGQAAFDLIMRITSGEFDQKMALESVGIPADIRNTVWPEMLVGVREAFVVQTGVYDWDCGLDDAGTSAVIQASLLRLFSGDITAEEFVAELLNA